MAFFDLKNVAIRGISACVPSQKEINALTYAKWEGYETFVSTTGIRERRKALPGICTSDLCVTAAERLIADLAWNKEEIDILVFVTQTPDYVLPATSCILQERLGLGLHCYTLDISLGCSGWVYGLSVIGALMQGGTVRKGLLLAGDTILKLCSPEDKSTWPLFGDAGTAMALEFDGFAPPIKFAMYTDGTGKEAICIQDGGCRNQTTPSSFYQTVQGDNIVRSRLELILDGMSVFSFGITKAPKAVNELIEKYGIDKESVDLFTFHQANLFMNEKIRKKLKLPEEKVLYSLDEFGNTSCASIPLTLVTRCRKKLQENHLRHIACGFGVGLSWGAVYFETNQIVCSDLIEL